jgi:SAM-dependent methyltransferase
MKLSTEGTADRPKLQGPEETALYLRQFHNELAKQLHDSNFLFFNYGLADWGDPYEWVRPRDHAYRYALNLVRRTLSSLDLEGKTVLDISSGRGGNCYYLLNYSAARFICGLDYCEDYLLFSRQTFSDARLAFAAGDACRLPFADGSADVILNVQSSHCYADLGVFLSEAYRVLKPGGTLAYADAWDLAQFPLEWGVRKQQLAQSEFKFAYAEEIGTGVSLAIRQEDGFGATFLKASSTMNKAPFLSMTNTLKEIESSLSEHRSSYWIYRLTKS